MQQLSLWSCCFLRPSWYWEWRVLGTNWAFWESDCCWKRYPLVLAIADCAWGIYNWLSCNTPKNDGCWGWGDNVIVDTRRTRGKIVKFWPIDTTRIWTSNWDIWVGEDGAWCAGICCHVICTPPVIQVIDSASSSQAMLPSGCLQWRLWSWCWHKIVEWKTCLILGNQCLSMQSWWVDGWWWSQLGYKCYWKQCDCHNLSCREAATAFCRFSKDWSGSMGYSLQMCLWKGKMWKQW